MGIETPNLTPEDAGGNNEKIFSDGEKFHLGELSESVRRIGRHLSDRERERLFPLIEEREIQVFLSFPTKLEELLSSSSEKVIEELEELISRLANTLSKFGEVPQQRMVRDSSEDLKRLSFRLREFGDVTLGLKSLLGSKEDHKYDGVIQRCNRMISQSEKVWLWLRKKADILQGR